MANEPMKNPGQGNQPGQGQGSQAPGRNPQDDQAADKREGGMGGNQPDSDRENVNDKAVE